MELMHGLMAGSATVMLPVAVDENGRLVVVVDGAGATVEIANDEAHPVPVAGPLTNDQLRAAEVPVSGPLTDAQLRAAAVATQGVVIATNGTPLATGSLPQELAYDAAGRLSTVTVMVAGVAYRRTLTYDVNGRMSSVSAWGLV